MKVAILYSTSDVTISQMAQAMLVHAADHSMRLPMFSRAHVAQAIDEALDMGAESLVIVTTDDLLSMKLVMQICQSYPEIEHVGPIGKLDFNMRSFWTYTKPTPNWEVSWDGAAKSDDFSMGALVARSFDGRREMVGVAPVRADYRFYGGRKMIKNFAGLVAGAMDILDKEAGPDGPALIATYRVGD